MIRCMKRISARWPSAPLRGEGWRTCVSSIINWHAVFSKPTPLSDLVSLEEEIDEVYVFCLLEEVENAGKDVIQPQENSNAALSRAAVAMYSLGVLNVH